MRCNNCNQIIPGDSEFCQYCGSKIESSATEVIENDTEENVLEMLAKVQAQETIKALEENQKAQQNFENDVDFGLVPEKTIYTLARESVAGQVEYLSRLRTVAGEKIQWNRRGSTSAAGVYGLIDIYDIYLLSGQFYKRIYINMYGAKASQSAPDGFVFMKPEAKQINIDNVVRTTRKNNPKQKKSKLVTFANISSVVLSAIAILAIIVAMVIQDSKRAIYEEINPTIVYFILLAFFGIFLAFAIVSIVKHNFKLTASLSCVLIIAIIIAGIESSVLSTRYLYNKIYYSNCEAVTACNVVWITSAILIFIVMMLPVCASIIKILRNKRFASVKYRENCYKRIAKMHAYLEKGIISQEEYEKIKKDILKHTY